MLGLAMILLLFAGWYWLEVADKRHGDQALRDAAKMTGGAFIMIVAGSVCYFGATLG